jgi:hypothetical protein
LKRAERRFEPGRNEPGARCLPRRSSVFTDLATKDNDDYRSHEGFTQRTRLQKVDESLADHVLRPTGAAPSGEIVPPDIAIMPASDFCHAGQRLRLTIAAHEFLAPPATHANSGVSAFLDRCLRCRPIIPRSHTIHGVVE